jgi:hypothetical protein
VAPVDGDDDTAMTSEPEEMSMTLAAVSSCWLPPLEQPKDSVMLHAMAAGWDGRMDRLDPWGGLHANLWNSVVVVG